ncbi:MAG: 30S ribosomal protein S18, small subunit ribosomal protein S18 [Candidatus Peregrinibacteria bacterium GW2011_GWF2_38_29]|nr:MAG: 30S ribosomal protein S18, small subunit ribosomal protein S18 [Candidatus Peregrinibacteria bacterium GW2011_GWF2_38_29]HBB02719.1 30S ribosomal protein S18 [Candidatus Peregrinibacteria bacterium]
MPTYQNRKCKLCANQIKEVDYKNVGLLQKYITKYMKIVPRYYSGTCIKHQKRLATAIKRARIVALMPFVR